MLVTKKNLLEWTTAQQAEDSARDMPRSMWASVGWGFVVLASVTMTEPIAWITALPFAAAWIAAPWVARRVSRPLTRDEYSLTGDDRQQLRQIARRTWRFFDEILSRARRLAPARQPPGAARTGTRSAHVADEHRPRPERRAGRTRPGLPPAHRGGPAPRSHARRRGAPGDATAATSTTGTAPLTAPCSRRATSRPSTRATSPERCLTLKQGLLETARGAVAQPGDPRRSRRHVRRGRRPSLRRVRPLAMAPLALEASPQTAR